MKVEKNTKWLAVGNYNRAAWERGNLVAATPQVFQHVAEVVGSTKFSETAALVKQRFDIAAVGNRSRKCPVAACL